MIHTISRAYGAVRAQALGVIAQLVSALPLFLISVLIARSSGLASMAEFTVLVGWSAFLFTFSLFGLRTAILSDRFDAIELPLVVAIRVIGAIIFALATVVMGAVLQISFVLICIVAFLRLGDLALDLSLAIDQVRRSEKRSLYRYLLGSATKLALCSFVLVYAWINDSAVKPTSALVFASAGYSFFAWYLLSSQYIASASSSEFTLRAIGGDNVRRIVVLASPFLSAQLLCAFLTVLPRVALDLFPDQERAGVYASALTISTFFGMLYYAIWLRWSPVLGMHGLMPTCVKRFFGEVLVATVVSIVGIVVVGAKITSLMYGVRDAESELQIGACLASGVIFFATMTTANIFKFSRLPWIESLTYLFGVFGALLVIISSPTMGASELLLAAATGMVLTQGTGWLLVRSRSQDRLCGE